MADKELFMLLEKAKLRIEALENKNKSFKDHLNLSHQDISNIFNTIKMNKILFSKIKRELTLFHTKITFSFYKQQGEILGSVKTKKDEPVAKLKPDYDYLLHNNLKHLDFINFLEMNYSTKQLDKFPVDFLQSFQQIKSLAQNNTINLIHSQVA